ncbi:MAG: hypothetical protein WB613_11225, partial [Pseudolabrys sp.]
AKAKATAINLIISSLLYEASRKDFPEECITQHRWTQFKTWPVVAALKRRLKRCRSPHPFFLP